MFSRKHRLTRRDIAELKKSRTRPIQGEFFGLIYQPAVDDSKFGLIISNKISKKATERNRVKRQLLAAARERFPARPGKFLFLAKKKSLSGTPEDFLKEMEEFERKIQ
jgi:ribonuclease P protein component